MNDAAAWERLCHLLDEDELLWPSVRAAAQDPTADPWGALLDGLDDAGALASLENDDTGMELSDALAQLPRVFRLQPDLGAVTDTDDLHEAMRTADSILARGGFRLLALDVPDDEEIALIVVDAAAVAEIGALALTLERRVAPAA